MNPAPSLYSKTKMHNIYFLDTQNQLTFKIRATLNVNKALNKGEGAG